MIPPAPTTVNAGRFAMPAEPIPILTYHNIGKAPDGSTHQGLYLSVEKFRSHLRTLERLGYRGVSMDEGLPYLRGEESGRVAIITLDDGYVDNLDHALPALQEYGFTATCYLVSERLGAFNTWDSHILRVRKPTMSPGQVHGWLSCGMQVGAHTLTHAHLPRLKPADKRREIIDAKKRLEDTFGRNVDHFCFPYGEYDAECLKAVADAGYATAVTTERARVRRGCSLLRLPRMGNSGRRSPLVFQLRALLWRLQDSMAMGHS